jgi:hypothetical protein
MHPYQEGRKLWRQETDDSAMVPVLGRDVRNARRDESKRARAVRLLSIQFGQFLGLTGGLVRCFRLVRHGGECCSLNGSIVLIGKLMTALDGVARHIGPKGRPALAAAEKSGLGNDGASGRGAKPDCTPGSSAGLLVKMGKT